MRIAVVGAGVAGLSAAWTLSQVHDVVLFERDEIAGGHARTFDLDLNGTTVPVDFGFLILHPWCYPNLLALLRHLEVDTIPVHPGVSISAEFADGSHWSHLTTTALTKKFQAEIERFHMLMRRVVADPQSGMGQTLAQFLCENEFTNEFQSKYVSPVLSMLFVTRFGALDIGLLNAALCFGPVPLLSLSQVTPFETIQGGSRNYVERLVSKIQDVRLGCAVNKIDRQRGFVNVHAQNKIERFDQIILATDAQTALKLLDRPTQDEQRLLGDVEYEPCRMVIHTDRSVLPVRDEPVAAYSFMSAGCHERATNTYSTYHLRHVQSWIDHDVFATANPPAGLIDPQAILYEQNNWKHIRGDLLQFVRATEMYRIQGKRRTWHCGSHVADSAWHEGSLRSGLAVAVALGANYPFADDAAASQSFRDMGTHLMRVVPRRQMKMLSSSVWPFPILELARTVIGSRVLDEIREKLRLGLPTQLFRPLSPLYWLREGLAQCIRPFISPYNEFKKKLQSDAPGQDTTT